MKRLSFVTPEGFEPPTNSTGNCHSIQLNYGANKLQPFTKEGCYSIHPPRRRTTEPKLRCKDNQF